jgi:GNAT superfamily N-acetyltransferase
MRDTRIRVAAAEDASGIARTMRAALSSFDWMPMLHTPGEDLAFIGNHVLPNEQVLVAEADGKVIGFIAVRDEWVNQLYLQPNATGQGVGQRLLDEATFGMDMAKLYCFRRTPARGGSMSGTALSPSHSAMARTTKKACRIFFTSGGAEIRKISQCMPILFALHNFSA